MERGWERAHPFANLTPDDAASLVGPALRPDHGVVGVTPLEGGLRNSNYRLRLVDGRDLALRLNVADPSACAREAAILRLLATGSIPAPRLVHCEPAADPPWSLLEWLPGRPLDRVLSEAAAAGDDSELRALLAGCGRILAGVHAIRFDGPGFLGPDLTIASPMPDWEATVLSALAGPVEERLGADLASRVRRTAESNGRRVHDVWLEAALVHADFKPWNLLASPSPASPGQPAGTEGSLGWRVSGLVDWEFACAGCGLIDYGTFLRDRWSRPRFVEAFADGYAAAGGLLPDDWPRLSRLVDLLSLLQMLAWSAGQATLDLRRVLSETLSAVE